MTSRSHRQALERLAIARRNASTILAWSTLTDKVAWRPAGLPAVEFWEWWRWRAVLGGVGLAAFGVLLLGIGRPEPVRKKR